MRAPCSDEACAVAWTAFLHTHVQDAPTHAPVRLRDARSGRRAPTAPPVSAPSPLPGCAGCVGCNTLTKHATALRRRRRRGPRAPRAPRCATSGAARMRSQPAAGVLRASGAPFRWSPHSPNVGSDEPVVPVYRAAPFMREEERRARGPRRVCATLCAARQARSDEPHLCRTAATRCACCSPRRATSAAPRSQARPALRGLLTRR
jgi:hypothetical protein